MCSIQKSKPFRPAINIDRVITSLSTVQIKSTQGTLAWSRLIRNGKFLLDSESARRDLHFGIWHANLHNFIFTNPL